MIAKRQTTFIFGNDQEWRKLRNEVKYEIEWQKQNITPPDYKAYKILKSEIGTSKLRKLRLDIPGVEDDDLKGKANAVNNMFAKVSAHIPSLIVANLAAYLPADLPKFQHILKTLSDFC